VKFVKGITTYFRNTNTHRQIHAVGVGNKETDLFELLIRK